MLPSPVWWCVWLVGGPGMEHPVGLPLCWCRDRGVRRDTRRGVCLVEHDLIVTRWSIAIRIAVATHFPVATRVAVAVPFPITMVSRRPRGTRQCLCVPRVFRGSGWGVGVCPRAGLPSGPSGGEHGRLPGCVQ
ncbi:hypothetical protein Taro_020827 [Colocasia esculenta]|uniref:Uncharacterized protein n=1 Tax=Colocasia esculenta TaxID=4460 RepID=A0A843V6E5_COLES|nr:hypothetical protein [Colocasia esculenta]